ncbi:hypothetical protein [Paracidovorax konjaci]|uniref:Uncharacterized protein n=1 Tax=Paracidovorax konjaci TaxID=32040 RepID=A0A1I1ZN51_9BURK|nr:hypothetical protein [Paracidovorax konjaci]SFE33109.1 hypothetical protein SAMN04489710_1323 [Paracidovorax konjaci]
MDVKTLQEFISASRHRHFTPSARTWATNDDSQMAFDSAGKLLTRRFRNGWLLSYGYQ